MENKYKFESISNKKDPDNKFLEKFKNSNIEILFVENEQYGRVIANAVVEAYKTAKRNNKKLVFDMATGSSPAAAWPELQQLYNDGEIDLNHIIVLGHEEVWGNYEKGDKSDFDSYRKREIFENNDLAVIPITDAKEVEGNSEINGNFIPLHLADDAGSASQKFSEIMKALRQRDDVYFLGLYGVGTDGHVGEIQINSMGISPTIKRMESYDEDIINYSYERGQFKWWNKDENSFHQEDNIFWKRGVKAGEEDVGRAIWQGYSGIQEGIGIGWRDLLNEDEVLLVFNNSSKQLAFKLALEGSFSGQIKDSERNEIMQIEKEKGEGELILPNLIEFAKELSGNKLINDDEFEIVISKPNLRCREILKLIYKFLDSVDASLDDDNYRKIYEKIWILINRYIGKRSPIGRLIEMRSLFGKSTKIIATNDVVKGTTYEQLLNNKEGPGQE